MQHNLCCITYAASILIGLNFFKSIFHLLLIYNHAVADGISGVILTNQILENYSKLKKNEKLDMACTRVKTIAELKSDEMPNGNENIQNLTDYANKVSRFINIFCSRTDIFRKMRNSKIFWRDAHLIRTKKKVSLSDKDRKRAFNNSNS